MAKMMSPEQAAAFEKVMESALGALGVFQRTGERKQFVAAQDQVDAYKEEFNAILEIKLEGKKIF